MAGAVTGQAGLAGHTLTQILGIVTFKNKLFSDVKKQTRKKIDGVVMHLKDLPGGRCYCGSECTHAMLIT